MSEDAKIEELEKQIAELEAAKKAKTTAKVEEPTLGAPFYADSRQSPRVEPEAPKRKK